jgi:hypothetical protein
MTPMIWGARAPSRSIQETSRSLEPRALCRPLCCLRESGAAYLPITRAKIIEKLSQSAAALEGWRQFLEEGKTMRPARTEVAIDAFRANHHSDPTRVEYTLLGLAGIPAGVDCAIRAVIELQRSVFRWQTPKPDQNDGSDRLALFSLEPDTHLCAAWSRYRASPSPEFCRHDPRQPDEHGH